MFLPLLIPGILPSCPSSLVMSAKRLRVQLFVLDFSQERLFILLKLYEIYGKFVQLVFLHQPHSLSLNLCKALLMLGYSCAKYKPLNRAVSL